jgi:predicted Zn-dependent protease
MEMPLYKSFFAYRPDKLPSDKEMQATSAKLVNNLITMKTAPVAEPYSGPALLSASASGVFFHEIFGHRVEGQRLKKENDAQTFKKKVGELVLPASLSVYCDPMQKSYEGIDLNGYYQYDDQGSKGERVNIVENGILKDFLMTLSPIKNFPKTNGHGRAQAGMQPVSRQSNLVIESSDLKTNKEIRDELIRLAKEQKKPYGYLFEDVQGGFTTTGRYMPSSFNVTPTLVYRVYTDGRPDEIVRGVDLIGTPLAMFSQIDMAGGEKGVFNGTCGAESGGVPVSGCSPMILVKVIETQKKSKSQELPYILPRPNETK